MTATDRLDAITTRLDAATPGPWEATPDDISTPDGVISRAEVTDPGGDIVTTNIRPADADLIAHAPTDLTACVTALKAVLELHRASPPSYGGGDVCAVCQRTGCKVRYPCPTVTAITRHLENQ